MKEQGNVPETEFMALLEESGQGDVLVILEEHEALLGGGEIDAAADHFLGDAVVAALGIVDEEGIAEPGGGVSFWQRNEGARECSGD